MYLLSKLNLIKMLHRVKLIKIKIIYLNLLAGGTIFAFAGKLLFKPNI